jgi:hypothetical protein
MIETGRSRSYICAAVLVIVSTLSYGQSCTDDGTADLRLRNPPSARNYILANWDSLSVLGKRR